MKKIVIESPLSGGFIENFRYLLWCCRATWKVDKLDVIASHMLNPWFMDDTVADERAAGIDNSWVWEPNVPHWFFIDKGFSYGMRCAWDKIGGNETLRKQLSLSTYSPECWEAYNRGEWPPHTPGFELKQ